MKVESAVDDKKKAEEKRVCIEENVELKAKEAATLSNPKNKDIIQNCYWRRRRQSLLVSNKRWIVLSQP